jgi:hypothetical protein
LNIRNSCNSVKHEVYDEAGRNTANMIRSTCCSCCNQTQTASVTFTESQTSGQVQFTAVYSPKHFAYVNLYVLESKSRIIKYKIFFF